MQVSMGLYDCHLLMWVHEVQRLGGDLYGGEFSIQLANKWPVLHDKLPLWF